MYPQHSLLLCKTKLETICISPTRQDFNEIIGVGPDENTLRCNPYIQNIDAISGALITLSLSILILDSQREEGARDGIDI